MEIHQTLPTMDVADAIGNYVLNIRRILKENGFESEIYAENIHKDTEQIKNYKQLYKTKGLLIHHLSIGSEVNDFVNSLPNKKILIYHGITPPQYFRGYNDHIAYLCETGLNQIKSFKNNVVLAIADSEYSRKELEQFGFNRTDVIPPIPDFDKFKKFNKDIYERLNDGKTNILFVGRVIPFKKFEDVIKVFYYYNNYTNPNSRLILVGSHVGMDLYYNRLINLIKNLKIDGKVIFTGKVSDADLSAYYRVSTNFLGMSDWESFCVPLVESMFFKIPIIAYNSAAVPYTLGKSGVLVNKKNYEEIAELINIINSDKSTRNRIIESQNKRLKDFEPKKIKAKLLKLIDEVTTPKNYEEITSMVGRS
jgi:glycosyltransferase involved in cell wall biosynthesis